MNTTITTVADDLIVAHEGTRVVRLEGLDPDTQYTVDGAMTRKSGVDTIVAEAILPEGTIGWFINLQSGDLVASSDYHESK